MKKITTIIFYISTIISSSVLNSCKTERAQIAGKTFYYVNKISNKKEGTISFIDSSNVLFHTTGEFFDKTYGGKYYVNGKYIHIELIDSSLLYNHIISPYIDIKRNHTNNNDSINLKFKSWYFNDNQYKLNKASEIAISKNNKLIRIFQVIDSANIPLKKEFSEYKMSIYVMGTKIYEYSFVPIVSMDIDLFFDLSWYSDTIYLEKEIFKITKHNTIENKKYILKDIQ